METLMNSNLSRLDPEEVELIKTLVALRLGKYNRENSVLLEYSKKRIIPQHLIIKEMYFADKKYRMSKRTLEVLGFIEKTRGKNLGIIVTELGINTICEALEMKHEKFT